MRKQLLVSSSLPSCFGYVIGSKLETYEQAAKGKTYEASDCVDTVG